VRVLRDVRCGLVPLVPLVPPLPLAAAADASVGHVQDSQARFNARSSHCLVLSFNASGTLCWETLTEFDGSAKNPWRGPDVFLQDQPHGYLKTKVGHLRSCLQALADEVHGVDEAMGGLGMPVAEWVSVGASPSFFLAAGPQFARCWAAGPQFARCSVCTVLVCRRYRATASSLCVLIGFLDTATPTVCWRSSSAATLTLRHDSGARA
jgi:hypothetical protein